MAIAIHLDAQNKMNIFQYLFWATWQTWLGAFTQYCITAASQLLTEQRLKTNFEIKFKLAAKAFYSYQNNAMHKYTHGSIFSFHTKSLAR
jgi:hypothetical protein